MNSLPACAVRPPTPGEIEKAVEIAVIAFQAPPGAFRAGYELLYRRHGTECMLVVEAEGELVASCLSVPGHLWMGEDQVPHAAVGAVATLPEARRHGYAGAMMTEMVRRLRGQGLYTSCLWPFSYAYYRKFGWEVGAMNHTFPVPAEVIRSIARPGPVEDFEAARHLDGVMALYDRSASSLNCCTVRDRAYWEDWLALDESDPDMSSGPKGFAVLPGPSGIRAYGLYTVNQNEDGKRVRFRELAAEDALSRKQLIAALVERYEAVEGIFTTTLDDPFPLEAPDPWKVYGNLHPGFSFLVTDPARALLSRTPARTVYGRIRFEIADPIGPPIRFTLEADAGHLTVSDRASENSLSMSVQTFSQIYSGCLTLPAALKMGLLKAGTLQAVHLFGNLFASRTPMRSRIEPG